jgi:hypothetical protein
MYIILLSCALGLSISLNAYLYFLFKKEQRKKLENIESEILIDILRGNALVRIERIAPESVFLRRY